jgi:hypothetical protein
MRIVLALVAVFALALGLAYALGRGWQALGETEVPVATCPPQTLAERFSGQILDDAPSHPRTGATLTGTVSGPRSAGPERVERLAVIQSDRLYWIDRFRLRPRSEIVPGQAGYLLEIPGNELQGEGDLLVTSACLPPHPVKRRRWQRSDVPRPDSDAERERLVAYLREHLPERDHAALYPSGTFKPRIADIFPVDFPGCERLALIGDVGQDPALGDDVSALVCLQLGDTIGLTVRGPARGHQIQSVEALDLDGDGAEELIVDRRAQVTGATHVRTLMWYDAAAGGFAELELGTL